MSKIKVSELTAGQAVASDFRIVQPAILRAKNGTTYLSAKAADKSGEIPLRMWGASPNIMDDVKDGAILHVTGKVDSYQNNLQLIAESFKGRVSSSDEDFSKVSQYSIEEMWTKLLGFVDTFKNSQIKKIAEDLLLEQGLSAAFQRSPAASGMHHAFVGGLLEHTWQMCETAEALFNLPFYANVLNRDLCLFGILFHDFGKIFEYNPDGFQRTSQGILVPHIPMTGALILETCNRYGVPEVIRDHLMHVVLAHHGKIEWGSPVTPAVPEAEFVHYVDNLHGTVFGRLQKIDAAQPGQEIIEVWDNGKKPYLTRRFSEHLRACGEEATGF